MFGIIYLILCILTGMEMVGCLFPHQTTEKGNRIWVILSAAFGTGTLMLTWAVYIVSWIFSVCVGTEHPLFYGNLLVMLVTALNPYIGYENAAKTAKKAFKENISLKEACVALGFLTAERFDEVFHPEQMV